MTLKEAMNSIKPARQALRQQAKPKLGLDANWNANAESYKAVLKTDEFPVQAFMPLLGVSQLSADLAVTGKGYDPFRTSTKIDADLNVEKAVYQDVAYTNIKADAHLDQGKANVSLKSDTPSLEFSLKADGNLDGDIYHWHADVDGTYIDLHALKFMQEPASVEVLHPWRWKIRALQRQSGNE